MLKLNTIGKEDDVYSVMDQHLLSSYVKIVDLHAICKFINKLISLFWDTLHGSMRQRIPWNIEVHAVVERLDAGTT